MKRVRLFHFDIPTWGNYGDTLLFDSVRQSFEGFDAGRRFEIVDSASLRDPVGAKLVDRINESADAVVLGGGGLFLRDTNRNANSGWQWNIPLEQLRRIEVPLIVFAIGNNRFYDQEDFSDPFREHLALTAQKSIFFGLRNHGSIDSIREYLPDALAQKVVYQPCPTTLASHLYPDLYPERRESVNRLAVESIVGKRQIRGGFDRDAIYRTEAQVVRRLADEGWEIRATPFARADLGFHAALDAAGVTYDQRVLYGTRETLYGSLTELADVPVLLGTRGHAQMVPFGMGTVPISLDVHPKTGYFATDIGHREWVLDPRLPSFADDLHATLTDVMGRQEELRGELATTRQRLFDTTLQNVADIYRTLTGETVQPSFTAATPAARALAERTLTTVISRARITELKESADTELREARRRLSFYDAPLKVKARRAAGKAKRLAQARLDEAKAAKARRGGPGRPAG